MGQKINPKILRLGPLNTWNSHWFDEDNYKDLVLEDYKIREALDERLRNSGVSDINIDRSINSINLTLYVSRPGMVIGRSGAGLEELKKFLVSLVAKGKNSKNLPKIDIRIEPIKEPNLDAKLVGRNIADQLLRRFPHKRVMNQAVDRAMASGAKGIKILLSGRIGGSEIARREKIQRGTVPLSTIRENVTFASVPALTKKGYIGIKVWINKPEGK